MQIKKRLQINAALVVLTAVVVCLLLFVTLHSFIRAMEASRVADEIVRSAFERSTFREDYLRTNSERARVQWFSKHEQIGGLLAVAFEKFRDDGDKAIVNEMARDQESTGRLFSAIVENREKRGAQASGLSEEIEERLSTQLNMRVYDKILNATKLQTSATRQLSSAVRLGGWGILCVLVILISTGLISSRTISRTIATRALRLRDGASVIGKGDLDHRIDIKGVDEFAELAEAFNQMTAKLQGSYQALEKEIEERKQTEAALRTSEERLTLATLASNLGTWDWQVVTGELVWSPRCLELFGLPPDYFMSYERFLAAIHPDDREFVDGAVRQALEQRTDYNVEIRTIWPDGSLHWVASRGLGYYDNAGHPVRMVGVAQDITQAKEAEEALRAKETSDKVIEATRAERQRMYDVLETLPAMICLMTPDYHVAFANRSFREKFGESNGRHCYDYCFGYERPCEFCESYRVLETGKPHHWEVTSPDGSTIIDVYDFPFTDVDGSAMILEMDIDITERKRAEAALKELNETLGQHVAERTAELESANTLLRNSRHAALNIMEDAVAARRQAEEASVALKSSLERLSLAQEASKSGSWEWDLRTNENFWSDELWRVYGIEPHSCLPSYDAWLRTVHPEDRETAALTVQQAVAAGTELTAEWRVLDRDGAERWLMSRGRPQRDNDGRPVRYTGIVMDITERKRAEAMTGCLAALVESADEAIISKDLKGVIESWNIGAEKIFGYTATEAMGRNISFLTPPGHVDEVPDIIERISKGEHIEHFESLRVRKDGTVIPVVLTFSAIRDAKGKVIGVSKIAHDISERRRAEDALKESEERLRLFVRHAPAALAMFDRDMRYLSFSRRWLSDYGLGERDLRGLSHYEVLPEIPERWKAIHRRALAGEVVCDDNDCFDRADGSQQRLRWEVRPWYDVTGKVAGIVVFSEDITERKRAEEALQKANEKLEEANRELEAFSYSVSHDLRAPLRHMSGFVELLQKRLQEHPDKKVHHYAAVIANAAKKMGTLIDDLLAFSRMGRAEMQMKRVSLNGLLRAVLREMQHEVKGRNIEWKINDLPDVFGDQSLLRLALVNLIANAVKYTRTRSQAEISIGCKDEGDEFVFFIKDNGVGFDMEYVDKLFGVFQRLHNQDEFEGTGIGLANVRRIISRHGGRTWAEGAEGQGATFYFTLPRERGETKACRS